MKKIIFQLRLSFSVSLTFIRRLDDFKETDSTHAISHFSLSIYSGNYAFNNYRIHIFKFGWNTRFQNVYQSQFFFHPTPINSNNMTESRCFSIIFEYLR